MEHGPSDVMVRASSGPRQRHDGLPPHPKEHFEAHQHRRDGHHVSEDAMLGSGSLNAQDCATRKMVSMCMKKFQGRDKAGLRKGLKETTSVQTANVLRGPFFLVLVPDYDPALCTG